MPGPVPPKTLQAVGSLGFVQANDADLTAIEATPQEVGDQVTHHARFHIVVHTATTTLLLSPSDVKEHKGGDVRQKGWSLLWSDTIPQPVTIEEFGGEGTELGVAPAPGHRDQRGTPR